MPVVETGESEDVETRVRPHCDGTGLGRAQIWRSGTHSRKQCEIWAQFQPNPLRIGIPEARDPVKKEIKKVEKEIEKEKLRQEGKKKMAALVRHSCSKWCPNRLLNRLIIRVDHRF